MALLPDDFLKAIQEQFDPLFSTRESADLSHYGRDATTVFTASPSIVVFPRSTDDVVRFVKLCVHFHVAVVPSGGRTGLAGGAVATHGEAILSFEKMNQIGPIDLPSRTLCVQAGAVTEAVHHYCAPHGLTWPVDFASKGSSQVGGNIATNAGGVRVIADGLTRNWVLGLQVVTMSGDVLDLNGALEKNNTGLDLRQLFIGTEGTLGIITQATLKLQKIHAESSVLLFALSSLEKVLELFGQAKAAPFQIYAFEMFTDLCVEVVTRRLGLRRPFPEPSPFYVLLECSMSSDSAKLSEWAEEVLGSGTVQNGILAQSPKESREFWKYRESISESLSREGRIHKNDIAVPIAALNEFTSRLTVLFQSESLALYLYGHIGDGNIHVNILKPQSMQNSEFSQKCQSLDQKVFSLLQEFHGSVSAEHGIGLLKKAALSFSRTPAELVYLRGIKAVLDPQNLLNPGKIFD